MMAGRRIVFEIEFATSDGVRIEFGERGLRILNVRQLGEAQRQAALALVERAEELIEKALPDPLERAPLVAHADLLANQLGWRITHKRTKNEEPPLR
jgi:hypothetical protein